MLTDLLARALAVLIIAPAVGLLGKLFLWRTATGVVTDEAIVSFLLHPFGMAALVVMVAVSLGVLFAETGQLMVIAFGAVEDRRVTWLDALNYAYRRVVALVHLAGEAFVRLLLISVPFLAAVGGIYWLLARTHDINYYLAQKPPEFKAAAVAYRAPPDYTRPDHRSGRSRAGCWHCRWFSLNGWVAVKPSRPAMRPPTHIAGN